MRKQKGLSRAETAFVIVVIVFVWVVGMKFFTGLLEKARVSEATFLLKRIHGGQTMYYTRFGKLSDSLAKLDVYIPKQVYFSDIVVLSPVAVGKKSEIASMARTPVGCSFFVKPYRLHVNMEGAIWCTGDEGTCRRLGLDTAAP